VNSPAPLALFAGFGIEMELMIVDRKTLAVRPIADELLRAADGGSRWVEDVERGTIAWSNEIVAHLVEFKTNGPAPGLAGLDKHFHNDVLEANRTQFPVEASVDEQATVEGAERAHLLRFDALPGQQEGAPDTSLLVLLADDGDGRLAVFNYAAPVDGFDDDLATSLVEGVGFDPDSDPTPPLLGNG